MGISPLFHTHTHIFMRFISPLLYIRFRVSINFNNSSNNKAKLEIRRNSEKKEKGKKSKTRSMWEYWENSTFPYSEKISIKVLLGVPVREVAALFSAWGIKQVGLWKENMKMNGIFICLHRWMWRGFGPGRRSVFGLLSRQIRKGELLGIRICSLAA